MLARQRAEVRDRIVQLHQIEGHDIVGIGLLHFLRELPALRILPQPQEILRELRLRGEVGRVKLQRLPLQRRPFREAILLRELPPHQMRHRRIRRPRFQRRRARRLRRLLIRAQLRQHRAIRVRLRRTRVHLQRLTQHALRCEISLRVYI